MQCYPRLVTITIQCYSQGLVSVVLVQNHKTVDRAATAQLLKIVADAELHSLLANSRLYRNSYNELLSRNCRYMMATTTAALAAAALLYSQARTYTRKECLWYIAVVAAFHMTPGASVVSGHDTGQSY